MAKQFAVILAGGKGERFWPLSTAKKPKQLLSLVGDRTLLGQAVSRLKGLIPPENTFVITNADLVAGCHEAAPELPPENIIGEPVGRDTAAAVALGAALVKARDPKGVFCILTADHVIGSEDVFRQTLDAGMKLAAKEDVLITIGITPTEPATGFGYIESAKSLGRKDGIEFLKVKRFVEKPDLKTAQGYLKTGKFFWNAGMFIWSVKSIESALKQFRPPLAKLVAKMKAVAGKPSFATTLASEYAKLEKISIDYAVMEHAKNIVVARSEFPWDDVGSWTALENHFPKDKKRNTLIGQTATHDAKGNIIVSRDHLTALVGVKNLIVVQADGVTLVCARDRAQDIKQLLAEIRKTGTHEKLL
jgi:mannose-1-phosphate guanylyltransferase